MLTATTLTSMASPVDTVNMQSAPQPPSTTDRRYHHGNLRETLVDAAVELARRGGPDAVVLREVSRRAGVSHNAAYRHFADHDELRAAVSDRCMRALATLMVERTDAVSARGVVKRAWARLEAIGRAYIEFAVTEPGWFRTAFAGPAHRPAASDVDQAADGSSPLGLLAARLDELVAVGAIPVARRPRAEYAAWSMVHGLSSLLVEGPLLALPLDEVDRAVAVVLAAVQRGL